MQDVVDFVSWFKHFRGPDISVGITKIRQITFQNVPKDVTRQKEGAAAGSNSHNEHTGDVAAGKKGDAHGILKDGCGVRSHMCNGCVCCSVVHQIDFLPAQPRKDIIDLLKLNGIELPPVADIKSRFVSSFANAGNKLGKKRAFIDDEETEYLMTYKTSM